MSASPIRRAGLVVGVLLGATLVAGCGGGSNLPVASGSPSLPSRSALPSATRTGSVPSRTASAPAPSSPSAEVTDSATAEPSDDSTRTASGLPPASASDAPTVTATATATATETVTSTPSVTRTRTASASAIPSETVTPSETAASASSAAAAPTASTAATASDDSGSLWWVWLLLAAAVAGGIGWFILASRRRRWDAAFANELEEARWVIDTLVPSVTDRTVPAEEIAQRWRGDQPRLDDLQAQLATLAATASGTQRSDRAARVSGAAATLRQDLASDVALRTGRETPAVSDADLLESRGAVQTGSDTLLAAIQDRPDPGAPPMSGAAPGGKHAG